MSSVFTSTVSLGDFIRKRRLNKGLSVEELCNRINIDKEVYYGIENNLVINPGSNELFFLFEELDLTFYDFDFNQFFGKK